MLLNNTMEETTNTMETSEDHSHQQMEAELTSLPIIDSSTRPSSVNNGGLHQHNNANIIEDLQDRLKSQEETISSIRHRLEALEARDKKRELALEAANLLLDKELARVSTFIEDKVLSLTNQVNANAKAINNILDITESVEKTTQEKLDHCDADLACIRKDLANFNQINKDFLAVVKSKMSHFDSTIHGVKDDLDVKIKEFRQDKKNSDWGLKMEVEERLDKFEATVEATNTKLTDLTGMYDDIQDRIWEIEKSWRNNLIFHGIRYDDPNVEEDPNRTEEKVRTVIRVDLQLSREIPILRAHRIKNGPLVKGTHPILVSFQNYNDREEVLRRSKLIRGFEGGAGRGIKVMGCQSEPHLYITEDSSRRVREQRSELIKFSREVHRRFPNKHCEIKYDKLYVDNEVYVWSDKQQKIERISPSHHHTNPAIISLSRVPSKYSKTLLEIDEADLQSTYRNQYRSLSASAQDLTNLGNSASKSSPAKSVRFLQ